VIGFLSGNVRHKDLGHALLDVGGVGYLVRMPLPDLARLGDVGGAAEVWVHTSVREDAIELFAFLQDDSLALFEKLIAVGGVGPKLALALLSGMEAGDLVRAILEGDEPRLVKVPGVGKKTAARIVLEMKDRLKEHGLIASAKKGSGTDGPMDDLSSALANLGYKPAQVERALQSVKELAASGAAVEDLVREALRHV
jgi:Holliday junction DNA helicase RuvA